MKETEEKKRRQFSSVREYLKTAAESKETLLWIWNNIKNPESIRAVKWMTAFLAISLICSNVMPYAIGGIINGLAMKNQSVWINALIAYGVCTVIQRVSARLQEAARERAISNHRKQLEKNISRKFFEKSIGQHMNENSMLNPATLDKGKWKVMDVQTIILFDGISLVMDLGLAMILLFFLSWEAGLIMAAVFVIYVSWSLYLNYLVANECGKIEDDHRKFVRRTAERYENHERVQTCAKEHDEMRSLGDTIDDIMDRDCNFWIKFIKIATSRSSINATGLMIIMILGAWLVSKDQLALGFLYPLYTWTSKVCDNIWKLGHIEHRISWIMPSVSAMVKGLEIAPAITDAPDAIEINPHQAHEIRFNNLSHSYAEKQMDDSQELPAAISGISFSIKKGEKVALIGPSGAGKSTLMKLLLRYYDPTSGSITIDGVDLRHIKQASWRKGIGYIPQHGQIFDGTLKYNILYGLSDEERAAFTDERLLALMKRVRVDFGNRLTNGFETRVGKRGVKLSGGECQRVMIAAAIAKDPSLLIIDEATSSLDSTTEKEVQAGLDSILSDPKTSALIIAHRLSTVKDCTKFVVLKPISDVGPGESQIDAIAGSFEELYEASPVFRRLADDQGIVIKARKPASLPRPELVAA